MLVSSQINAIRSAVADVWIDQASRNLVEIIETNARLSPLTEADPGPIDLENNPYWRQPIEMALNPSTRKITILKSTQVGGTIISHATLYGLSIVDPAPAMLVFPTRDEARKQRDRIYQNGLVSGREFSRLVPPRRFWNMTAIELGATSANIAFSGSAQRLRGKPCKRIFLNETDVYEFKSGGGDPHKAAAERTKQFFDYLIYQESTPVGDESYIYAEWLKSQRRRWFCECPHCGTWQDLRFFTFRDGDMAGRGGIAGYRDASGELLDPAEARIKAHYVCVKGCRIDQEYKNSMVVGGRWLMEGQYIDETGITRGEATRDDRHVGFHIWTIHQSKITIGDIAAKFCESTADGKIREFFQDWLGLRYKIARKMPRWEVVAQKYKNETFSAHTLPPAVWFVTIGVDVQEDRIYFGTVGWAPLRTPYLIDWGERFRQADGDVAIGFDDEYEADESTAGAMIGSDLAQVPTILNTVYPVLGVNPLGLTEMAPRTMGIDTGWRRNQVYDLVAGINDPKRCRAFRGDDKVDPSQRFRPSAADINPDTGKPFHDGLKVWRIYKSFYQEQIDNRLAGAPGQPTVYQWPQDILPRGKKLVRQLTNVRKNERGIYVAVSKSLGEDYRDCLAYAETAADMVVGSMGWSAAAWHALKQERDRRQQQSRPRDDNPSILHR